MENILETIMINISRNPKVVENVFIGAYCSPNKVRIYTDLFKHSHNLFPWTYEEMLGINPHIVEHEIKTYDNAKLGRQNLRPVNPRKVGQ